MKFRVVKSAELTAAIKTLYGWLCSQPSPTTSLGAMTVLARAYEMAGGLPAGTEEIDKMAEILMPMFVVPKSEGDA